MSEREVYRGLEMSYTLFDLTDLALRAINNDNDDDRVL